MAGRVMMMMTIRTFCILAPASERGMSGELMTSPVLDTWSITDQG